MNQQFKPDKKMISIFALAGIITIALFGSLAYHDGHNIPISTEEPDDTNWQIFYSLMSVLLIVLAAAVILVVVRLLS